MRVLLLPSVPYEPLWRLHAAGAHPRPTVTEELARDHGIVVDSIDPDTGWKNPLGRKHPFLRAYDPLRTLRVLMARRDYDLVVSGNDGAAMALVEAQKLFRFRTPIAIWDFSPAVRWRIRIAAQNRAVPRVSGIIALNEIQRPYVAERWGAHIPVIVVGHWVDTAFFDPMPAGGTSILAVGDDAGRDYPTLLDALEDPSAPVTIRTGLPLALTERHANVTVARHRLEPIAYRALYADSAFVVVPLHRDTRNASGISTILEAGAMGKAVVVGDSDGIREFVRHEETGLVVPPNDKAALRAAIDRLIADPVARERLGQAARRAVESTASPVVFAARLAAAFRAVAAGCVEPPAGT